MGARRRRRLRCLCGKLVFVRWTNDAVPVRTIEEHGTATVKCPESDRVISQVVRIGQARNSAVEVAVLEVLRARELPIRARAIHNELSLAARQGFYNGLSPVQQAEVSNALLRLRTRGEVVLLGTYYREATWRERETILAGGVV